jgi:hypothetical protein
LSSDRARESAGACLSFNYGDHQNDGSYLGLITLAVAHVRRYFTPSVLVAPGMTMRAQTTTRFEEMKYEGK